MAEELELFTNPMSRGRIARWMLEEVGVPYRTHMLEYGTTMKAPDYLAVNPMGKVPALRHGDTIVTECAAICTYLADAFPEADLAPPVDERGAYYRWLYFAAGPFEAATVNHSFGFELDAKQQMISGYGRYETVVDVLEQAVTENRFI
ncbi:MAG: glutathione S-transferase N-terminal domain-containing protein, partial [Alphaproteobacteria bacterium]|nr:glutathione S-transferase N-terminal domain-containing protein [Alphaproteobacteria bacterium]